RTAPAMRGRASGGASELNLFELDLASIVHAQAELGTVLNVAGLADEPLNVRVIAIASSGLHMGAIPHRVGSLGFALIIDDVDQQPVDGDRIGSEHHLLGIEPELSRGRKRAAVPDTAQAIHHL